MTDLKVVMMGLGYIGLPTAALIATFKSVIYLLLKNTRA
jgi:UDP-N-acetyl-D-mannosaminuronate dehydrogenase